MSGLHSWDCLRWNTTKRKFYSHCNFSKNAVIIQFQDYIMWYTTWTWVTCTSLLPFLTLLSLNIVIYRRLKLAKKVSARLHSSQPHQQSATERTNLSSSTILLCTVATFLVCHSPRLLLSVYEAFMIPSILNCQAKLWKIKYFFVCQKSDLVNSICFFLLFIIFYVFIQNLLIFINKNLGQIFFSIFEYK